MQLPVRGVIFEPRDGTAELALRPAHQAHHCVARPPARVADGGEEVGGQVLEQIEVALAAEHDQQLSARVPALVSHAARSRSTGT